ncbi:MAG TPA: MlaD family protein [Gammaproteobacteria bacterium]
MKITQQDQASHYIHRTSYSFQEQMVGMFVLIAVGILLVLFFFMIKQQNLFEEYFEIYGKLRSAQGLSTETVIQVSGIEVGYVSAIDITDNNDIQATMRIFERYHRLIRQDSEIKVSSLNATLFGKSIIEITVGSPDKPKIEKESFIRIKETTSIDEVIAEAKVVMNKVNGIIDEIYGIVGSFEPETINHILLSLKDTADNINRFTEQMNSTEGGVGALAHDTEMKDTFKQAVNNLEKATRTMEIFMSQLNTEAGQVPAVMQKIQSAVDEANTTIQATQKIWPISSAIDKPEAGSPLINPVPAND